MRCVGCGNHPTRILKVSNTSTLRGEPLFHFELELWVIDILRSVVLRFNPFISAIEPVEHQETLEKFTGS